VKYVYVHGDRMQSDLIAVVCLHDNQNPEKLLQQIQSHLISLGFFTNFEIPQGLIISTVPWTVQSGFLLGIGKLNRRKIRNEFQNQFDQCYISKKV